MLPEMNIPAGRWMMIRWFMLFGLVVISVGQPNPAQPRYTVHDLGTLVATPGLSSSYAWGIHNSGQVVGVSDTEHGTHAFRTGANSPIDPTDDLGTLGGAYSTAFAINDGGTAVGQSGTSYGENHAFVAGDGMSDLGTLAPLAARARLEA